MCFSHGLPQNSVRLPHHWDSHTSQNVTYFLKIFVFKPLHPSFLPKCNGNRLPIAWPINSNAGLLVIPLGSKVVVCHNTSPHTTWFIFGGLTYCMVCFWFISEMMFPSLPPLGWVVPIVWIIATNNGHTCNVHHLGCQNLLLLARSVHLWFIVACKENSDTGWTCSLFCSPWWQ